MTELAIENGFVDALSLNLYNLHRFWVALGGENKQSCFEQAIWPNHHWRADFKLPDIQSISSGQIVATIDSTDSIESSHPAIFNQSVGLTVMSLDLNSSTQSYSYINSIARINKAGAISDWVNTCSRAFGYQIDQSAIEALLHQPGAQIFAYYANHTIAGTAISFQTGDVMGIHQVGVHPHFQGQGVARKLMHHILADTQAKQCRQVSLQASDAGLKLYRQLGFKVQAKLTKLKIK